MRNFVTAVIVAAFVILGSAGYAVEIKPVVIDDNPGGSISTFQNLYAALRESGVPVILRGICISACTLILELPKNQVCVEPTASLGFHLVTNSGTGQSLPEMTQALIRRYYPPAVQGWLATKELEPEPIFMNANEIVALGIYDFCSKPGQQGLPDA